MKLLVLSQFFPYPPINGGRQRAYQLVKGLAQRHEVHLLSFAQDASDLEHVGVMSQICGQVSVVPEKPFVSTLGVSLRAAFSAKPKSAIACWSAEMDRMVRDRIERGGYDAAIALTTKTGIYLSNHSLPKILDNDNVDSAYLARIVEVADGTVTKFRRKLTWVKAYRQEKRLVASFDAVTAVSEQDRQELERLLPSAESRGAIHVVPNGVDLSLLDFGGGEVDSRTIISTGALTYPANFDAAIFFCDRILPRIKAEAPDVRLVITGRYDGVDAGRIASAGAVLTGFVDDIRPVVAESAALVVPLRIGGGTRLKILEAMALGTPVVSTGIGAAGLGLEHGRTALLADDPEEFAKCAVRLMKEPGLRETLSENGRAYVAENFGWQKSVELMEGVLNSLI